MVPGSLAGNLMMKNAHNDFPSDVFLSLETAGAVAEVLDVSGASVSMAIGELPYTDMNRKLFHKIRIPLGAKVCIVESEAMMNRRQRLLGD